MFEGSHLRESLRADSIGERHRVELFEVVKVERDAIAAFRDLDQPDRIYREAYSHNQSQSLEPGQRGSITLEPCRFRPGGRWSFEPDQVEGIRADP